MIKIKENFKNLKKLNYSKNLRKLIQTLWLNFKVFLFCYASYALFGGPSRKDRPCVVYTAVHSR